MSLGPSKQLPNPGCQHSRLAHRRLRNEWKPGRIWTTTDNCKRHEWTNLGLLLTNMFFAAWRPLTGPVDLCTCIPDELSMKDSLRRMNQNSISRVCGRAFSSLRPRNLHLFRARGLKNSWGTCVNTCLLSKVFRIVPFTQRGFELCLVPAIVLSNQVSLTRPGPF